MGKVWRDIDQVVKESVLPEECIKFNGIMKEKPNFNKNDNSRVIYRKNEYIIIGTGRGFIVHNKKYDFHDAHTHTGNFQYAKSLIDLCIRKKLPKKPSRRLVESLERINRDSYYIERLKELRELLF